jgi:toxin-antitoxin system PIN domain toxin
MRHLCDSNVFLALAVGQHAHHPRASAWFSALGESDTAEFCRATGISFLRLLTQKVALDYVPLTNRQAWDTFDLLMKDDATGFAVEPEGLDEAWRGITDVETPSPKVWMDAYLASFAITARMRLVTMDKDFKNYERHGLDLLLLSE